MLIFTLLQFSLCAVFAQNEISLFDAKGKPIAYIDMDDEDDDCTIYLWDGRPAVYLWKDDGDFHIYGFNGKHLGWYSKGIIRDHDGNIVGASKKALDAHTDYEPYKSLKRFKPFKHFKQFVPVIKPYMTRSWSTAGLETFLLQGVE